MDNEIHGFSTFDSASTTRRGCEDEEEQVVTAFEQRDSLLKALATSSGSSFSFITRILQSCRYLDPYPEDVEHEFSSIVRRLEEVGQEGKGVILGGLWERGLRGSYSGLFDQIDYGHRVLLFLIKLSGNVESSLVTRECGEVLALCTKKRHTKEDEDAMLIRELMMEDEEDEEGQWWRSNIAYSSGEELSDWSDDGDDDDAEHGPSLTTVRGHENMKEENAPIVSTSYDVHGSSDQDARAFMRQRVQTVVRDRNRRQTKSTAGYKRLYGCMSLSVWLSSNMCRTHVSDVLHPKYCVPEHVFVSQMLSCIRGLKSPGFLCSRDRDNAYKLVKGVHLEDVSVGAISCIADEVLMVANALRAVDDFVLAVMHRGDEQGMISSYADALRRQAHLCRDYITATMYEGRLSVAELVGATRAMRDPACLLQSLCVDMSATPAAAGETEEDYIHMLLKDVIDRVQSIIEEHHLECSSCSNAYVMAMAIEIFVSACIPLLKSMDAWMQSGNFQSMSANVSLSLKNGGDGGGQFKLEACPKLFEDLVDDVRMIGMWSEEGMVSEDSVRLARLAIEMSERYVSSLQICPDLQQYREDKTQDTSFMPPRSKQVDHGQAGSHYWAREWLAVVNDGDASLSKDTLSELQITWDGINPSDHSVPYENIHEGLGQRMKQLMAQSSKNRFESIMAERGIASTWCRRGDAEENNTFIHQLRQHAMQKVDSIMKPEVCSKKDTGQETSVWPTSPSVELQQHASKVIGQYSAQMREDALSLGLVDQVRALKSFLIVEEHVWGPLLTAFFQACSSRIGVDSVSISNFNAIISNVLGDNHHLQNSIASMWLEGLSTGGIDTSFTSRRTSYVKVVKWHVDFNAPLNAMLSMHGLDCISDFRDLMLQLMWVWKTVANAQKNCLKLKQRSAISREHHACLFSITVLLRHVMLSLHMYLDVIFDKLINRIEGAEALLRMKQAIDTAISTLSSGEFSHNMALRGALEKWLDASLAYGILVNRFLHNYDDATGASLDTNILSPNTTSYTTGLEASRADVWHATKHMMSVLEDAKTDHGMVYHHLLIHLWNLIDP
ncbi:hypothetical protein M9435_000628 [Picochlorum sp. BPE23]|nr:hypothetical protein M9435_000628 [Picochlorum sp. BPE23]